MKFPFDTAPYIRQGFSYTHWVFPSLFPLYGNWDRDTLGVSYNYLKNYGLSESHPYNGKKCIIRKGTLITSPHKK